VERGEKPGKQGVEKTNTAEPPAGKVRGAADSVKPGVERGGTPGIQFKIIYRAREAADRRSSNISFIVFDAIRFQELYEFITKGNLGVMCFLALQVILDFLDV
jgi:hypothetical protein